MIAWDGPENAPLTVLLAPGDRGRVDDARPMAIALSLAAAGLRVVRVSGMDGDRPRSDAEVAMQIRDIVAALRSPDPETGRPSERPRLVLGGFSRGARVCADLAQELGAVGLVGFAYPFHKRRDPDPQGRVQALLAAALPTLICQGTRDSHGNQQQVRGYDLPARVRVHWLADANHAWAPRTRSGTSREALVSEAAAVTVGFVRSLLCV